MNLNISTHALLTVFRAQKEKTCQHVSEKCIFQWRKYDFLTIKNDQERLGRVSANIFMEQGVQNVEKQLLNLHSFIHLLQHLLNFYREMSIYCNSFRKHITDVLHLP